MTTETAQRDRRTVDQRVADYRRELAELRAVMDARARMDPESPEFRAALEHEEELLRRIHTWSLGQDATRG